MKITITKHPRAQFSLSKPETELLMRLSEAHYDSLCRLAGKPGGFIFGWNNFPDACTAETSSLDIALKILEVPDWFADEENNKIQRELATKLRRIFFVLRDSFVVEEVEIQ